MEPNDRPNTPEETLESWKEIEAYLKRDFRTLRRWEREEGLPIHRHTHKRRASVYAYPSEIDAWRASRTETPAPPPPLPLWRALLTPPRSLAFGVTLALCLMMVGNGIRPQAASAQEGAVDRLLWSGGDVTGRVSPDGRFITWIDWKKTVNLMVHDVVSNSDRALTKNTPLERFGTADYSAISKDSKQVAFGWSPKDSQREDLFIASLQGEANPHEVFRSTDDIRFLAPMDWSSDGKWIVAALQHKDGTGAIAMIAVEDGALRVLKSTDWKFPGQIFFSPDGKYVAYELPANDTDRRPDIFVLSSDGSHEIPAVVSPAEDKLLGWSPDGAMLLFSSNRNGSTDLWAQAFADGELWGSAEMLRPDIGYSAYSLGTSPSGSLYIYKEPSSLDIRIAPIDLNAAKLTAPPVSFPQGFLGGMYGPNWSPDGKSLAYPACYGSCLAIRSAENGEVRKVPHNLLYVQGTAWSPDGRYLAALGRDAKWRDGVYRIKVETGETDLVAYTETLGSSLAWSPDGKLVYYYSHGRAAVIEHNLTSGAERAILQGRVANGWWALSPDGRTLALETPGDPADGTAMLHLLSVEAGDLRELQRVPKPPRGLGGKLAWTPDGRELIVMESTDGGKELWGVPVDGSAPHKLDIDPQIWAQSQPGFTLSSDGQRIGFLMGTWSAEVWVLENFLPGAPR